MRSTCRPRLAIAAMAAALLLAAGGPVAALAQQEPAAAAPRAAGQGVTTAPPGGGQQPEAGRRAAAGRVHVPDRGFAPLQPEPGDIWSDVRSWGAPGGGARGRGAGVGAPDAKRSPGAVPPARRGATPDRRAAGSERGAAPSVPSQRPAPSPGAAGRAAPPG